MKTRQSANEHGNRRSSPITPEIEVIPNQSCTILVQEIDLLVPMSEDPPPTTPEIEMQEPAAGDEHDIKSDREIPGPTESKDPQSTRASVPNPGSLTAPAGGAPAWLKKILTTKITEFCKDHENLKNYFCIDPSGAVHTSCGKCTFGPVRGYVLKVSNWMKTKDYMFLNYLQKHVECSDIQIIEGQGWEILFMYRMVPKSSKKCLRCQDIIDDAYDYCSVACKFLEAEHQNDEPATETNTPRTAIEWPEWILRKFKIKKDVDDRLV